MVAAQEGRAHLWLAASGLSPKTVRSIVTASQKAERERRKLKKRTLNREAAARYRARMRGRALIKKDVTRAPGGRPS